MTPHPPVTATRHEAFIATLAHEFRQPLSALTSAIEIINTARSSTAADLALASIQRQTRQMTRMVDDLMDAARWASGKVTLQTMRVDVRALVQEAADDAGSAIAAGGLTLVVTASPHPLWVDADPVRLQQALSNLVANAIKFTPPGGSIFLSAGLSAFGVAICVSDTGRGMERETLEHVFDLFSQAQPGEHFGLGIGLSVVKEITTRHHGMIEARSQGPGRGSKFILTLPELTVAHAH